MRSSVEGEFDSLLVQQEAGCLVSPVALGSATARLTARWYGELVGHRTILVAYDRDEAGRRGTERLLKLSPHFKALSLPEGKDITDFYLGLARRESALLGLRARGSVKAKGIAVVITLEMQS